MRIMSPNSAPCGCANVAPSTRFLVAPRWCVGRIRGVVAPTCHGGKLDTGSGRAGMESGTRKQDNSVRITSSAGYSMGDIRRE